MLFRDNYLPIFAGIARMTLYTKCEISDFTGFGDIFESMPNF